MVMFKKTNLTSNDQSCSFSSLVLTTKSETLMFDCHAIMWGTNFRYPTFQSPQKKIKFCVTSYEHVDRIFVMSSDSLGIIFVNKDINIYMTQPVFEQILAKFTLLKSLNVAYDDKETDSVDSDCKILTLDDVNIDQFKRNVKFITYNERLCFNEVELKCKSSGLFLGWCSFVCTYQKQTVQVSYKYTDKKRYTVEYTPEQTDCEINLNNNLNKQNPIDDFNVKIQNLNEKRLLIGCDMVTIGVDLMFHLLFITKKSSNKPKVYLKFIDFFDFLNSLSNHTDWITKQLNTNKIMGNFVLINDLDEVKETTAIILIDKLELMSKKLDGYDILTINDKLLKGTNCLKKTDKSSQVSLKYHNFLYLDDFITPKNSLVLCENESYNLLPEKETVSLSISNSLCDIDENTVFIAGSLTNSDKDTPSQITLNLKATNETLLSSLFKQERYFCHNDSFYFPRYRLKVVKTNTKTYKLIKY